MTEGKFGRSDLRGLRTQWATVGGQAMSREEFSVSGQGGMWGASQALQLMCDFRHTPCRGRELPGKDRPEAPGAGPTPANPFAPYKEGWSLRRSQCWGYKIILTSNKSEYNSPQVWAPRSELLQRQVPAIGTQVLSLVNDHFI